MTFFQKYLNWLFIALCVAGLLYGKLSVEVWLLMFSAGTIVFIYFAVVFLRERNFFEQHLSAEDLAKFKQLLPLINPLGIKIANPTLGSMEKERNAAFADNHRGRVRYRCSVVAYYNYQKNMPQYAIERVFLASDSRL